MRVALIFQGLIDRTTIFAPMENRPNVLMEGAYGTGVQIINDAETMLEDGMLPFSEWLKKANTKLTKGCRIIGCFKAESGLCQYTIKNEYSSRYDHRDKGNSRLQPKQAPYPENNAIYTLESMGKSGMSFKYPYEIEKWEWRPDTPGWKRRHYFKAQKMASCTINARDEFVLNIDAVTSNELRRHLYNRTSRREYVKMWPLLQTALQIKSEEEARDLPFLSLIAATIAREGSWEEVLPEVMEVAQWYKVKGRTHVALTGSKESVAFKQIVKEVEFRRSQAEIRSKTNSELITKVLEQYPDALLIAHRIGPHYKVILPAGGVFVHEEDWKFDKVTSRDSYAVMTNRYMRWHALYKAPEWDSLEINPNPYEHLTEPEKEERIKAAFEVSSAAVKKQNQEATDVIPIAMRWSRWNSLDTLMYNRGRQKVPEGYYLTGEWKAPQLIKCQIEFKKDHAGTLFTATVTDGNESLTEGFGNGPLWWKVKETKVSDSFYDRSECVQCLSLDKKALAVYTADKAIYDKEWKKKESLESVVERALKSIEATRKQQLHDEVYHKFLKDHGDIELWEGHKKQHAKKMEFRLESKCLGYRMEQLVESGVNIEGMSVQEIMVGYIPRVDKWTNTGTEELDVPQGIMGIRVKYEATV
jgi:hypothetical protein